MTNPKATLHMANGADIVIELLPQAAPNTVNSFIYAASHGYLDHHAIERIVPGNWVDVSYTAFGHKELQYLIPNEFTLHPDITPLDSHPGCVCMGWQAANFSSPCVTVRTTREPILCLGKSFPAWMRSAGSQPLRLFLWISRSQA